MSNCFHSRIGLQHFLRIPTKSWVSWCPQTCRGDLECSGHATRVGFTCAILSHREVNLHMNRSIYECKYTCCSFLILANKSICLCTLNMWLLTWPKVVRWALAKLWMQHCGYCSQVWHSSSFCSNIHRQLPTIGGTSNRLKCCHCMIGKWRFNYTCSQALDKLPSLHHIGVPFSANTELSGRFSRLAVMVQTGGRRN